jgi:enamine deaminase RidA (YjgF/YER057c/UK114 family)
MPVNEGPITPAGWLRGQGFSHAILHKPGRTLHLAGIVSLDPRTNAYLHKGDFVKQWGQILDNMCELLQAAGAKPEHVGALRLYVTDRDAYMNNREALGRAFRQRFGKHFPAMTLVGVAKLFSDDVLIEVEADAVIPDRS